jgi:hypothetical protein
MRPCLNSEELNREGSLTLSLVLRYSLLETGRMNPKITSITLAYLRRLPCAYRLLTSSTTISILEDCFIGNQA